MNISGGDKMKKLLLSVFVLLPLFVWALPLQKVKGANDFIYRDSSLLFEDTYKAFDETYLDYKFTPDEIDVIKNLQNTKLRFLITNPIDANVSIEEQTGLEVMHAVLLEKFFNIDFEIITTDAVGESLSLIEDEAYDFATNFYDMDIYDVQLNYANYPYLYESLAIASKEKINDSTIQAWDFNEVFISNPSIDRNELSELGLNNVKSVGVDELIDKFKTGEYKYILSNLNRLYSNLDAKDGYIYSLENVFIDTPVYLVSPYGKHDEELALFSKAYELVIERYLSDYKYELQRLYSLNNYMESLTAHERLFLIEHTHLNYTGYEFSPYFIEEDGEINGLVIDLLQHFSKNNEIVLTYVPLDELDVDANQTLNDHLVDFYMTETTNDQHLVEDDDFYYVGPYASDKYVIITNESNDKVLTKLTDIYYEKVGFLADDFYQGYFIEDAFPNAPYISYYSSLDLLLKSISEKEITYSIIPYSWYVDYSINNPDINTKVAYLIEEGKGLYTYIKFSKSDEGKTLASLFNKYLNTVYLDDIFLSWENRYDTERLLYEHSEKIYESQYQTKTFVLFGTVILILLVAFYFRFRFTRLNHLMNTDDITKLKNRNALLKYSLLDKPGVIVEISLHQFKEYSDIYGEDFLDEILIQIVEIIKENFDDFTVFKNTGNEFYLLKQTDIKLSMQDLNFLGFKVQRALSRRIIVNEQPIQIEVSIGIHVFDETEKSVIQLLKTVKLGADYALKKGINQFEIVSDRILKESEKQVLLEQSFKDAIRNKELIAYYQPLIESSTREIYGFEALCRWKKGNQMVFPNDFLPIAEKYHLMKELDLEVLKQSLAFYKELLAKGFIKQPFVISVNLSEYTLNKCNIEELNRLVDQYGVSHSSISFEIIENISLNEEMLIKLGELRSNHYQISIDDFSAGYTSFNQITKVKLDKVKLDRMILPTTFSEEDAEHRIYIRLVRLIHGLGFRTLAEGVETEEQAAFIKEIGVDYQQGYLYSKPVDKQQFEALFKVGDKNA